MHAKSLYLLNIYTYVCFFTDLGEAFPHISKSYLATVAIDFGTTYSGFAFSFNKGGVTDSIFMNRVWINEQGHRSMKTPTSLLLKPDQSFHSFGYDAEATYFSLKSVLDEKEYWFFQHFKMYLHNDEVRVKFKFLNNKIKSKKLRVATKP